MKIPTPFLGALGIVFILQAVTNGQLAARVASLEKKVDKMEKYYEANAGTEYGLGSSEQAVFEELVKLKKRVEECCAVSSNRQ